MSPSDRPSTRYRAAILGTGHYVPNKILDNAQISKWIGKDDEWITSRCGVKERRIAAPEENSGTMAVEAARRALASAKLDPHDLDLIIVCTFTPEKLMPSTACLVQHRLGITRKPVPAFDLTAACTGFLYGMVIANAYMQLGNTENVLVIGTDTLSRTTDYTSRGTSILFGDGAGAMVLQRSPANGAGLLYSKICADGSGHDLIHAPGGLNGPPEADPSHNYRVRMDGPKVYKLAVARMTEMTEEALDGCGIHPEQINLVVPHQANQRIIESVMDKVGVSMDRVYTNIDRLGNTSAASIPIAYDEALREGRIRPGDLVLMVAFGGGLTWGCTVVRA